MTINDYFFFKIGDDTPVGIITARQVREEFTVDGVVTRAMVLVKTSPVDKGTWADQETVARTMWGRAWNRCGK